MADVQDILVDQADHHGAAHAGAVVVGLGSRHHLLVGVIHGSNHGVLDRLAGTADALAGQRREVVHHRLHRQAAGDLAGVVAAHAVGDQEEVAGQVELEVILVVGSHLAGIGLAGSPQGLLGWEHTANELVEE